MTQKKAMLILGEGVEHLEFAMKVFEWQVRRGRWLLFEHLLMSKAWSEAAVQRCMSFPGVGTVQADQCQFGLRSRPEEALNKKPTTFMSNSRKILSQLAKRCDG